MTGPLTIRYLTRRDIDVQQWDRCIVTADNSMIYGQSRFLDLMVNEWAGLVLNDYEAVMPLPVRRKWGIHYLYQPFLTPILGIFGNHITPELVTTFLDAIPTKFRLWDYSLNHSNSIPSDFQEQYTRANFILPLNGTYEDKAAKYSDSIHRNITKAMRSGCMVRKDVAVADIIDICRKEWPAFTKVRHDSFDKVAAVYAAFESESCCYGVYHPGGKLLAACLFLGDHRRSYYWLVGNDPSAKEMGASPMLIDQFIRDHAGKDRILDFEGSDAKGVAEFYRRFGAIPEPYTTLYRNKLPLLIRGLKKTPYSHLAGVI